MLLAVMDLGSNSFKMTVAQYVGAHRKVPFKIIHKERHPVQLGASVFEGNRISDRHRILGLKALKTMKTNLQKFNMPLVKVVGTSAVREAKNGKAFVKEIHDKLGLAVNVISGIEEAKVISQGLEWEYPFVDKGILVDIGGGSTEVAPFGKGWSRTAAQASFCMGSVRLALDWESQRTQGKNKNRLEELLRAKVKKTLSKTKAPTRFDYLVGSAGAIQSLRDILSVQKNDSVIHRTDLDQWISQHIFEDIKSLRTRYRLAPSRARVLLPGAIILSEILEWLNEEDIFVTEMTLRNGLLVDFVEELKSRNWILEL